MLQLKVHVSAAENDQELTYGNLQSETMLSESRIISALVQFTGFHSHARLACSASVVALGNLKKEEFFKICFRVCTKH